MTSNLVEGSDGTAGPQGQRLSAASRLPKAWLRGYIRSFLRQAMDLLDHPDRSPGWGYDDPVVLQSAGRSSIAIASIMFGLYAPAQEPSSDLLTDVRVVRGGGHPWQDPEVIDLLRTAGYADVAALERTWHAPVRFVVSRKS